MPANLTPQYQKAEEEYRRAASAEERLACLEKMLVLIPKHKGTDKLQAELKSKISEARGDVDTERKSAKKVAKSYKIPPSGAGQVMIVGAPNAGKSRILKELTNAQPEVAPYPFTTREPMPGMMPIQDVAVQLIDTPPITDSVFEPYLAGLVRGCDLVLLCFDGANDDAPQETATVVQQFADRKTYLADRTGFVDGDFSKVAIKTLLVTTHAHDPDVSVRLEFFADACPKADPPKPQSLEDGEEPVELPIPFKFESVPVELDDANSVEQLRAKIYQALGVIRVYTKVPGKPADMTSPFTIPVGGTVEDLALRVHKDLAASLKFAKVWGTGVRDGQQVSINHVLADANVVELHT